MTVSELIVTLVNLVTDNTSVLDMKLMIHDVFEEYSPDVEVKTVKIEGEGVVLGE